MDIAIGSRYIKGSLINPKPTLQRRFVSRIYNIFIRSLFLFPYRDTQCGAKVLSRGAAIEVTRNMQMTKWAFDVEMLYVLWKNNFSITEVPTVWSDKKYSTINFWKSGPWMALAVLRLRILHSPFKKFIKIYDKLIGWLPS